MISEPLARAAASVVQPPEDLLPSEWAARHRVLSPAESEIPGPWSNDVFPALRSIMDAAARAIAEGRVGVAFLKAAQVGGSEAALNVLAWASERLPGSALYITSTDDVATEVARERIDPLIAGCAPLRDALISGRGTGQKAHVRRFPRGAWTVAGSQSVTPLESSPRRIVILDEVDRMRLYGGADPIDTARTRTQAYRGDTLIVALGHPATEATGIGRLYYRESDRGRGHIECPMCGVWFWLDARAHLRCEPRDGEPRERAEVNASRYVYRAPCCGGALTDARRWAAIRHVEQRTTLHPEEARAKRWIGVHTSIWYAPGKMTEELVAARIAAAGDEPKTIVVVNKCDGDVYAPAVTVADPDTWRACAAAGPDAYACGVVPRGVQFLTAGTDHRATQLHAVVWGWGLVRDTRGAPHLCAWLIDHAAIERARTDALDAADLAPFDALIYDRTFPRAGAGATERLRVLQGAHDAAWQRIATYGYCLARLQRGDARARPCRGERGSSSTSAAAPWRDGAAPQWKVGASPVRDPRPLLLVNTYAVKSMLVSMATRSFVREDGREQRMAVLPSDADDELIEQLGSEHVIATGRGELEWRARTRNHYFDASVYAMAVALQLQPTMGGRTRADHVETAQAAAEGGRRRKPAGASGVHRGGPIRRYYGG